MNSPNPLSPLSPQDNSFPGPIEYHPSGGARGGVRRYLVFLRRYWWIPLITFLLASGAGVALVLLAKPVYVSTASMYETERLHLSEGFLFTEDASTYIGTQIELLKSARLAQQTLETMRAAGTNGIPTDKNGAPLKVTLSFREAPKTTAFEITASSADPAFSQNYLNALMNECLAYKKNVRELAAGATATSITAQVEALERELQSDEKALSDFQESNNLAILQTEGNGAGGYLEKLQTDLSQLQLESQLLQASDLARQPNAPLGTNVGADMRDLAGGFDLPDPAMAHSAQLTPAQDLQLLRMQRKKLSQYLRPKHPKIMALDAKIADGEAVLKMIQGENHAQLLADEEAIKMKMVSTEATIKDYEQKVTELSARIAEAERLRQNVSRSQSMFDRLNTMLENVDISRNTDLETLAILEPASDAKRTYSQVSTSIMLAFAGLAFGLALVFLIEKRDDRFTSVFDVSSTVGDAVVGQLPELRNGKEPVGLLEVDDSRHGFAESYRNLRSALIYQAVEGERPKVILITSAMPGEGKSTVAANLARALALAGSRVLLVDADLRKGSLHESLKMASGPGLAELLRHTSDAEQVVQRGSLANFFFVSRGSHPGNPGDLFLGSGLDEVLAKWRREFDYVLVDSSPVFAADDASCLAPKVDGTLFVVRRSRSSARAVSEALDVLGQRQARLLGVIFNGADAKSRTYYFYKYGDYSVHARTA